MVVLFFIFCSYTLLGGYGMDKDHVVSNYNHSINILERKNILVTGVK